jgi:hypothetical protein
MRILIWIGVLAAAFSGCSQNQPVLIKLSEFGLKSGTGENAIPAIIKAVNESKKYPCSILLFEKGRYDFRIDSTHTREYFESNTTNDGPKHLAVLIEGCKGLTIDGGGADFIFHGPIQPISVDNSENIVLKNINIDWEIPMTAQAKIVASTPVNIDLEIDTIQFPYEINNGKLIFKGENWTAEPNGFMEYVAGTHLIAAGTGDGGCIRGD